MGEHESRTPGDLGKHTEEGDPKPLFELGQMIGTPGALQALVEADKNPIELLFHHQTGDWGNLTDEDKKMLLCLSNCHLTE